MLDAIVVGAGVVGASVAYSLAASGASVIVLEAGEVAAGTSGATFAVDITRVKTPRDLFELSLASAQEHATMQQDSVETWLHPASTLEWESTPSDRQRLRDRVERLHDWGYPAQWLSAQLVREIEPALALPTTDGQEVAFFAAGGWYEPAVFARTLLDRAQQQGAVLRRHDPVTAMSVEKGRITEVDTAAGGRFRADVVVNCSGPQATEVAALAGARLPLRRVPGMVVTTDPCPTSLRTILAGPDLNIRPHTGDRLMLHSWSADSGLASSNQTRRFALASDLLNRARSLLPTLGGLDVQSALVGERPVPADGLPMVGHLADVANLYTVVAHSAVHLAPILGRLAARELTGHPQLRLAPFRPTRVASNPRCGVVLDENTRAMLARITPATPEEHADVT